MDKANGRETLRKLIELIPDKEIEGAIKYIVFLILQSSENDSVKMMRVDDLLGKVKSFDSFEELKEYLSSL
ncbi:MAG: hypothetical protein AB9903_13060 [Vulcanimicrobiota bacterium]